MRKYLYLMMAAVVAALLTALPTAASASGDVLILSGGGNAAGGDVLAANLASGTTANFCNSDSSQCVKCSASTLNATVGTNPPAPGTATLSLTKHTFGSCTTNISGTSIQSVTVDGLPYNTSVSDGSSSGNVTVTGNPIQTTVIANSVIGQIKCVYQPTPDNTTIIGSAPVGGTQLSFSSVKFGKTSGPLNCLNPAFFSAAYGPVQDTSQGNQNVTVN